MKELHGDKVLIVGYGREGKSTYAFLRSHFPELTLALADSNPIDAAPKEATLYTGPGYLDAAGEYTTIIRTPVIPPEVLAQKAPNAHLTTATNLFFSLHKGRIVAVTGTKGKSTTSSLIAHLLSNSELKVRFGGNIGAPILDHLDGGDDSTVYVVELSSFQLEDLRYSPDVAVLLNIVPEHLDHHGSFDRYVEAKRNISKYQKKGDYLITGAEYPYSPHKTSHATVRTFSSTSLEADLHLSGGWIVSSVHGKIAPLEESALKGNANLENLLAGTLAALTFGISPEVIRKGITSFKPLEHRLESVGTHRGITFVNDSLATIPEALINALSAFPEKVDTLIAGGYDRGLDLSRVGSAIVKAKVRNLILFPTTGAAILKSVQDAGGKVHSFDVTSMEDAVKKAYEVTSPHKICLLSPASSSFNLFKDYRDRAEQFKRAIAKFAS